MKVPVTLKVRRKLFIIVFSFTVLISTLGRSPLDFFHIKIKTYCKEFKKKKNKQRFLKNKFCGINNFVKNWHTRKETAEEQSPRLKSASEIVIFYFLDKIYLYNFRDISIMMWMGENRPKKRNCWPAYLNRRTLTVFFWWHPAASRQNAACQT